MPKLLEKSSIICYKCKNITTIKSSEQWKKENINNYECKNCEVKIIKSTYINNKMCCNSEKGCIFKTKDDYLLQKHHRWFCEYTKYHCWMCTEISEERCYFCALKTCQCEVYYGPYMYSIFRDYELCYFCLRLRCFCKKYYGPYRNCSSVKSDDLSFFEHIISSHSTLAKLNIKDHVSAVIENCNTNRWTFVTIKAYDITFLVEYFIDTVSKVFILKMVVNHDAPENFICSYKLSWELPNTKKIHKSGDMPVEKLNNFDWNVHIFSEELSESFKCTVDINISKQSLT